MTDDKYSASVLEFADLINAFVSPLLAIAALCCHFQLAIAGGAFPVDERAIVKSKQTND